MQLIYELAQCCTKRKKQQPLKSKGKLADTEDQVIEDSTIIDQESSLIQNNGCNTSHHSESPDISLHVPKGPPSLHVPKRPPNRNRRGQSLSVIHENAIHRNLPLPEDDPPPKNDNAEEGLHGLFHHLKVRQDKMRAELEETAKWYKVATKMDRVFFWSYGISVTILTLYAFVFKPMHKHMEL